MEHPLGKQSQARICFYVITLLLAVAVLLLVQPFLEADEPPGTATYSHGVLHLTIPYRAAHPGAGHLTLEIVDPENHVLGRVQKTLEVVQGSSQWKEEVKLEKALALDELVWHRLRYRFAYNDRRFASLRGTESISQILRMPLLRILGQQSYLSGSQAAVRVIATDSHNQAIPGQSSLRIDLQVSGQRPATLFNGQLNHRSTSEAQFRFPSGLTGNCELHYFLDTPIGSAEFTQGIRLQDKVSILLTTEKPIYQPSQIIHIRALALDRAYHEAAGNRDLVFEVEDSRGNKVFKKAVHTDEFGIASAEFQLADEVNVGTYRVRGLLGEPGEDATNTAEISLNVEKYVLPKFKVELNFTSNNQKTKHGYRPGDQVSGTVQANYFFGKPLDNSEVSIKATGMDVTTFMAAFVEGKTGPDGIYHFNLQIPSHVVGRPLNQGAARLLIEATVKDSAGHSETKGEPITVSESPFMVMAVPEGGTLIPNLENQVFLVASYPDGSPVRAELTVRSNAGVEQRVQTDDGGVAVIQLKAVPGSDALHVEGKDTEGDTVSTTVPVKLRAGEDQVLLRTEHAVYRAGDPIHLHILATKQSGTAYIDFIKQGQTILTRDLDITDGGAELNLTASPEMAGTVDINVYIFGHNAQSISDHRLIFVQPAEQLKIETAADAAVYKPGDDAKIRFHVTDSRGQGVRAALGLQIVDEAVFALAEKQPGFAKVFFYLEQEVMKPKYEIHSVGPSEIVEPSSDSQSEQRDRAGRVLFSATEIISQNRYETEIGRTIPQTKYYEYRRRYQAQFQADAKEIAAALKRACADDPNQADVQKVFEKLANSGKPRFRDPWGTPLRLELSPWELNKTQYLIRSAGIDKQFNTGDDLTDVLYFRRRKLVAPASDGPSRMEIQIEHDRGALNDRAEISGLVVDQWGGAVEGAVVTAREISTGKVRTARADASGNFRFSAVPKGKYGISVVSSPPVVPKAATGDLTLEPRDHAVLRVHVKYALAKEFVEVTAGSEIVATTDASFGPSVGFGIAGGVPGGVAGGSMGGVLGGVIGGTTSVRVRSYFPEALYINPEIITDGEGNASISVPVADNITTWRMAMLASTQHGALGTATSRLKVFQDFFVDLDLPVTLTQGDQVSIPVAIYNYSGAKGEVLLSLESGDWFSLVKDAGEKSVSVDTGRVGSSQFTLEAKRIGKFKLALSARMQGEANRADIVVREIEVVPNGREQNLVFNGQLESTVSHNVEFPPTAILGASKIFVRLYPGPLSQIMEGMDAILRMPGGCFEQTSSSTYPNVLALDYMKRTKKLTPEVHAKAEGYIANGYQRLLTFEVPGGGFSWFGQTPANKILTAYGLMEFYDMSKIHDVDPRLIQRTQQWLAAQQLADGSWKPDTNFINEGVTNRYNSDVLRITAYIAWALGNTGYQGGAVEKASQFLQSHLSEKADAYTMAVLANFAVDYGKDHEFTRQALEMLLNERTEKDEQVWWSSEQTSVYSTGTSASVETTGLAAQALLKWGQAPAATRKALSFLTSKKDASGTWGNTQATIMALRALLSAAEKGTGDVSGNVEIALNGKSVTQLKLTAENSDLFRQFVFKDIDLASANRIDVRFEGKGNLGYQVVGQYFVPWDEIGVEEPLSIAVHYDRTHLAQDDIATATATVRNNLKKSANMVMVDLGIPPGFDLLSEDLQDYQDKSAGQRSGRLQRFSLTATQAILYFDSFAPGETVTLPFRLRAKYPIRARTFSSRVYEYYDPDVSSVARPVQLEIQKR